MKLTLSQIRAQCKDYFFTKNTMRFFRGAKYSVKYDKDTDINYIKVEFTDRVAWYRFDEKTGLTHTVDTVERSHLDSPKPCDVRQ